MRAFAWIAILTSVACGRASPDPVAFVDKVGAEDAAREVCFDKEDELTAALDDDYLAADTVLLQEADVDRIARDVAFDSEEELRTLLDDVYLPADTVVLTDADIEAAAIAVCFDNEAELTAELDDQYLPIGFQPAFGDLLNIPAGFVDGIDNDTLPTGVAPIAVTGAAVRLDTAGCVDGETQVFNNATGTYQCVLPGQPRSLQAVGNATAQTGRLDVVPIVIKAEVNLTLAAGVAGNHAIFTTGTRAQRDLLIIDAWAVGTGAATDTQWNLRDAANDITSAVAAPAAAGVIERATDFVNAGARQISTTDDLTVRAVSAAGEAVTFTVFVLAIPL